VPSRPRGWRALAPGALAAAFLVAALPWACTSPESFIVLVIKSSTGAPITNVAQLTVVVSKGTTEMKTLSYGAGDLTLVADADLSQGTLSVSFSGGQTGDITFAVEALDGRGCDIGDGSAIVTIKKGAINEGVVALGPGTGCTTDGGGSDAGDGADPTRGCNLVHPQCAAANQTCQVNCTTQTNACMTGGTVAAGGSCQSAADCTPGTQCFDYGNLGCAIKICLPFCDGNSDCAAFASGGAGPGSFCRDPVVCPNLTTASHTCTFNCDPTAAAASVNGSGCPSDLACLLTASLDEVDCACAEKSRTGHEGDACTSSATCAPGLICNAQGGAQSCRPICRCDAVSGSCTATGNDCPTAGTRCTPVSNDTIYGICS
jgi:hypothetical protein